MKQYCRIIGIVIPTTDNSFFSNFAYHAEKLLYQYGCHALICSSDNNAEKEKEYLKMLVSLGVEGIICISGLSNLPDQLIPDDFPLVWVDRVPASARRIPFVTNDDEIAMKMAVEYLISKGCRDILLAPGYLAEDQESPRVKGYRESLQNKCIKFCEDNILKRRGIGTSESETAQLVRDFLRKGRKVDGIITSSDRAALGAMTALRSVGLYIPEDIKLISFDNSPYSAMTDPPITVLDRNPASLAAKSLEILQAMISNNPYAIENIMPVALVERFSTR